MRHYSGYLWHLDITILQMLCFGKIKDVVSFCLTFPLCTHQWTDLLSSHILRSGVLTDTHSFDKKMPNWVVTVAAY